MKILKNKNDNLSGVTLILGFFDGIHLGHRAVINAATEFAKNNNSKTVLLTFPKSPAEYFGRKINYIYPREYNYELISELGVDYIIETDFSEIVNMSAKEYLKNLCELYLPLGIFTGFNYTFGAKKQGNPKLLEEMQAIYNYKYSCVPPVCKFNKIICSTLIKELLQNGDLETVNVLLGKDFSINGTVIKGNQIGRTIGFPTANIEYPKQLTKIPYGVYKVKTLGKNAILNWGIKPTIGENKEILEVHLPDFNGDLYNKELSVSFIKKIRDEKKFNSLEELKLQIQKDTEECLK